MRMRGRFTVGTIVAVPLLMGWAGCGKDRSERKYRTVEGTVREIDPSGKVSMRFRNEEGIEITVEGTVADNAEIWINGRQAVLADVKAGDAVKVQGYAEGEGIGRKFVATKIDVERETFEAADSPQGDTSTSSSPPSDGDA